ncbi:MAG TPA: ABC transporter ATP-binding protein, partial [Stellaceae bacterium]|nr:ABC transporter ATP-binding protein [Stellaceae bacterium]
GRLLAHGTVAEVVHAAGIAAWRIRGVAVDRLMPRVKALPGVETAALFGAELHVSGVDAALIEKSLAGIEGEAGVEIERVQPSLEDVFIHTMDVANAEAPR